MTAGLDTKIRTWLQAIAEADHVRDVAKQIVLVFVGRHPGVEHDNRHLRSPRPAPGPAVPDGTPAYPAAPPRCRTSRRCSARAGPSLTGRPTRASARTASATTTRSSARLPNQKRLNSRYIRDGWQTAGIPDPRHLRGRLDEMARRAAPVVVCFCPPDSWRWCRSRLRRPNSSGDR